MFGFYKVAAISPMLKLGDFKSNSIEIAKQIKNANKNSASIALFSELTISGYTMGDLFFNSTTLNKQLDALQFILDETKELNIVSVIGVALKAYNRLYNCAVIIQNGKILGIVPKSYIPNKQEFYESRHFISGRDIVKEKINLLGSEVPFGVDLLFSDNKDLLFGVEICEDLWAVTPPSNHMASNGANLILNLSASNEIVGKAAYRSELVRTQSARLICAYAYASSGLGESGSDTIFGGDLIVAEYGSILKRDKSLSFDSKIVYADIDLERVSNIRLNDTSFAQARKKNTRIIELKNLNRPNEINRSFNPHPFVPKDKTKQLERANEITDIQAYALIRRMKAANIKKAIIGISGGLDSTLALLSTHKAFKIANWDFKDIVAITMPGFGTTGRTYNNAKKLCEILGVTFKDIDIKEICLNEFSAIGHDKEDLSVTYENVQARARTAILMNMANKVGGLVIGTGDLSEIALGWSTYNGDHMSMYGLNSGIPKTLIKYLIDSFAKDELEDVLKDILNTPISPELLPNENEQITQVTEDLVGPYELHDFFLYHFIREGFSAKKILFMAQKAFSNYDEAEIKKWLKVFIKRFFTQQFKRNCMPDGVMVGTISLSPRANWRMPSDANFESFLEDLDS
jgi:NAD+ synthase (glutamine-hydrolysing)